MFQTTNQIMDDPGTLKTQDGLRFPGSLYERLRSGCLSNLQNLHQELTVTGL